MLQVVEMTHSEKVKMYQSVEKDELIEMLIEANNAIDQLSKPDVEHSKIFILRCEKCNRVIEFLTKNSFKNESGKVYTCTCGHKTGVRNPKLLTDIEYIDHLEAENKQLNIANFRHGTPISDKHNASIDSDGNEDLETWIYELGLLLDKKVSLKGFTNAQRIEIALRMYCA